MDRYLSMVPQAITLQVCISAAQEREYSSAISE